MSGRVENPPTAPAPRRKRWRRPLRVVVLLLILYVGSLVVLMLLESRFLYRPTPAAASWAAPPTPRVRDVALPLPDGSVAHAWWCPPENWQPSQGAVLFCHGNAGNVSLWSKSATRWENGPLRQAVLLFDYPGFGKSDGAPTEKGCYAAADAAYDYLTGTMGVEGDRVILHGVSLGGGVAVELATRRPHRALVLTATFTSIADVASHLFPWIPARWMVRQKFDNLAKIGRCRRPVFHAHGTDDRLIPFVLAERLHAEIVAEKEFFPLVGASHAQPPGAEWDVALARFLAKVEGR